MKEKYTKFKAFIRNWYGLLLVLFAASVGGFFLGWTMPRLEVMSGTTLAGILSISGALGGGVGYVLRLWLNERGLTLAHRHRIVEDKAKRLHEYIEQYYLPMCSKAERLRETLITVKPTPSQEQVKLSFFRLIQWYGILRKWMEEKGGTIFLEDPTAEKLIKALLNQIQACLTRGGYLCTIDIFKIFEKAEPNKSWSEFEKDMRPRTLKPIYHKYEDWITKGHRKLCGSYLHCFCLILAFEVDATLQPWYRKIPAKPSFNKEESKRMSNVLECLKEKEDYKDKYLRRIGLSKG